MAIKIQENKTLSQEKSLSSIKTKESVFCLDCVIDWCKNRNQVSYCSQKYKGTSCYSCDDSNCSVKKTAGQ
ncbi:MAG: hypothetical protein JXA54_04085 [Candidatus Heimdallarchaeota archaeon]|nr:hypothetical protein [Candidatus Heimdallarchaeota archaeon]